MKSKCTCVSLEAKLNVINCVKKGESYSCNRVWDWKSTVGDFNKNEEKIIEFATTMESLDVSTKKYKVARLAEDVTLDKALYLWFVQKPSQNLPVSGPILCEKSKLMHAQIHNGESVPTFPASKG